MRKPKINVLLGLLVVAAVSCLVVASVAAPWLDTRSVSTAAPKKAQPSQRPHPQDIQEFKNRFAKTDFDAAEPSDPVEKEKRKKKGKHFDKMNIVSREPTRYWSILVTEWDVGLPALPAAQSIAVLILEPLTKEAHLSDDKTGVYSEFTAKLHEVLKSTDPLLTKDSLINISRPGGVVRYRTGEETLCAIKGLNMPKVGKRYLLFLRSVGQSKDFEIVTGYELENGKVKPLDDAGQFKTYKGVDEGEFLNAVRAAIAG